MTVSEIVVCAVKLPEVPETVIVDVPVVAVPLAVKVSVLVVDVGFGLKPAVTPDGKPDAARVTLPLKPPESVTVMVLAAWLPCCTVTERGAAFVSTPATADARACGESPNG